VNTAIDLKENFQSQGWNSYTC